jgi:hypothetical protein
MKSFKKDADFTSMNFLLDVDGVLIRDQKILERMKSNISHYVRAKVPRAKNPDKLRDFLYRKYGHTGRGLVKEFGIPTPDFNIHVYDGQILNQLAEHLMTEEFRRDGKTIRKLLNDGHTVTFFSNAPMLWTVPIAYAIDERITHASLVGFKPQPVAYTGIRANRRPIIYVDDVRKNLLPVKHSPLWVPVHYSPKIEDWTIPTIHTLDDLPYLVDYVRARFDC